MKKRRSCKFILLISFLLVVLLVSCSNPAKKYKDRYDLGVRYLTDGNYKESVLAFTAALEIDPMNTDAISGRAEAYWNLAKAEVPEGSAPEDLSEEVQALFDSALADYLGAIRLDPSVAEWYKAVADIYLATGRKEDAISILRQGAEATGDQTLAAYADDLEPPSIDARAAFVDYFSSGNRWDELLDSGYSDMDNTEINSVLADVDADGIDELLISVRYLDFSGPRGYEENSLLLDLADDGTVQLRQSAYYGGGTMGGDYLQLRYDTQEQRIVLVLDGYIADGIFAGGSYTNVYADNLVDTSMELYMDSYAVANGRALSDVYQEFIDKVRQETDLYKETDDYFYDYKLNNSYISEEEFDSLNARFSDSDSRLPEMQLTTADNPVPGV